jgi:hypothetical protein
VSKIFLFLHSVFEENFSTALTKLPNLTFAQIEKVALIFETPWKSLACKIYSASCLKGKL